MSVDTHVLQRVDALGRFFDFTTNHFRDELCGELGQSATRGLSLDNLGHFLPDSADLRRAGICRFLDLVWTPLREGNAKQSEEIVIGSLDCDIGFNEGLPLPDKGPQLVGGEIQAVEVGEAILPLDFIDAKFNLAESMIFVTLQVSQRHLKDPPLQRVVRILETTSPVHESFSNAAFG